VTHIQIWGLSHLFYKANSWPSPPHNYSLFNDAAFVSNLPEDARSDAKSAIAIANEIQIGPYSPETEKHIGRKLAPLVRKLRQSAPESSVLDCIVRGLEIIATSRSPEGEQYYAELPIPHCISEPEDFPPNELGLGNNSVLRAKVDLHTYGMPHAADTRFQIAFDGKYIRCQCYCWGLDQLSKEITEWGIWELLRKPELAEMYAETVN